jgi:DNA-binding response OmpR family regulator
MMKTYKACIVHIDDDEAMREQLSLSAKKEDWLLFSYPYMRSDLVPFEQIKPDLIILDFQPLLGGAGWEFLQLLKMNDATANIPIMVITTPFRLSAEIQDYLLTRYIKVVHKPFDVETLLNLVGKTLMEASQSNMILSGDRTLPILLVDDDEELRDNFVTVLRLENYRVITARNGQLALDTVSEADFCLILLDIDMPIMNGYQFLNAYAQQLRPHSPVIVTSANPDVLSHVLPAFVVDILTKPFYFDQLLEVVRKYAEPVSE